MLMIRFSVLTGAVLVLAVMLVGTGRSGDTKKETGPKGKALLPKYWSKLGLSSEQKDKARAVTAEYNTKIAALKEQLKRMEKEKKAELYKILTEQQKTRLQQIINEQIGGGEKTPEKKSTVDKNVPPDKK
jgi:hypothetical protein